jgi:hypothetical protein
MAEHHGHVEKVRDELLEEGFSEGHVMSVLSLAALVTGTDVPDGFTTSKAGIGYGKGAKDMLAVRLAFDTGMDADDARRVVKGQLTRASAAMKREHKPTA